MLDSFAEALMKKGLAKAPKHWPTRASQGS